MPDEIPFPPLLELGGDEVQKLKEHLLSEIGFASEEARLSRRAFGHRHRVRIRDSSLRPIWVAPVAVALVTLILVPVGGAGLGARAVEAVRSLWNSTPANQPGLDAAASDAESAAGSAYYTDAVVDDAANKVTVYLAGAPQSIIDQLQAMHPGLYVFHNDAAHPLSELLQVENSLPLAALSAQGIDVVSAAPTPDGYLKVGVSSATSVQTAQAWFDSADSSGVVEVYGGAQEGGGDPGIIKINPSSSQTKGATRNRRHTR